MCRSSAGTLAAQNNNPYNTPNVVYVPGLSGSSAPAALFAPAPAPGPVVALGPLGSQAQVAAQNTSFGETQLSGVGPIYKKQDSLEPVRPTTLAQTFPRVQDCSCRSRGHKRELIALGLGIILICKLRAPSAVSVSES